MPKIGDTVAFVTSKGHRVPAIVLTTPETYKEGSSLAPLKEGELNLRVFRIRGDGIKLNVPSVQLAEADPENNDAGEVVRVWEPLA